MAGNLLDTEVFNQFAVLVTFLWGSSSVARYARWTEDVVVSGNTYTSIPEMSIETGKQDGSVTDQPFTVTIPTKLAPITTLTSQRAHAPVRVEIYEVNPATIDETFRTLWKGTVASSILNPNGAIGLTKVAVAGWKTKLTIPLGIVADSSCAWMFGDKSCKIDRAAIKQTGTISAITGSFVTITGLTNPRTNYFQNGEVRYDGLGIGIRGCATYNSDHKLLLYKTPPSSWLSQTVDIYPGCDKKIASCRLWSNEAQFGGFGIAQQSYHPMLESPS